MMLTGPTAFYTIAAGLRDALSDALVNTVGGCPQRVGVVNGAMAWDECDACGNLMVSLVRNFISERFPEPISVAQICAAPYHVAEFAIQVVRCAPTGDDGTPSVGQLETSARMIMADAHVLLTTVNTYLCGLQDDQSIDDYLISQVVSVGPQGACVGNELHLHVSLLGVV